MQPGQLGVLVHVALDEQRADLGVEADGQEQRGQLEGLAPQLGRVLRDGEGVQVDDAVERVAVLVGDPVAQRPEQVAERGVAGGLACRRRRGPSAAIVRRAGRPCAGHGLRRRYPV